MRNSTSTKSEAAAVGESSAASPPFEISGLWGEYAAGLWPPGGGAAMEAEIRRVIDPSAAVETLHWGRNYLFSAHLRAAPGEIPAVVKQFRNDRLKERWRRKARGSKAERSWRVAGELARHEIPTPRPLLWVESEDPSGPSWYVCEQLEGVVEARYLLRAAAQGEAETAFPEIDLDTFLDRLGGLLRRLHEAGIWHRDLSVGNVLVRPTGGGSELYLIDLNRARVGKPLTLGERNRDFCRLALFRRRDQERFLRAYWRGEPGRLRRALFQIYFQAFELKNRWKKPLRRLRQGIAGVFLPRKAHPHIPAAKQDAKARDRSVWDPLSDQPHQHAGRAAKAAVRLADARSHLEVGWAVLKSTPRIWRRYRQLQRNLERRRPLAWDGVGICVRPDPEDPERLMQAIDELGVDKILLRLHPWQDEHDAEEALARELHGKGYELAFSLPQDRELVTDPERWRASIAELAERFTPFGRHFQVGQAINRSKWGIWRMEEYVQLAQWAGAELRRYPGVELLGPAVIDFEHHAVAGVLNLKRDDLYFDAVASLLYVDRRGAPENEQAGFDTIDKILLLRAIAETARNSGEDCWITEVNWPLKEGPHSPAGKGVAVDEEQQADYLVRYYLAALGTGVVERVYWWQLVARGYGLMEASAERLRPRPSYRALAFMARRLQGSTLLAVLPSPEKTWLYHFRLADGGELVVGWSLEEPAKVHLPRDARAAQERDGEALEATGQEVEVRPAPRYFELA